jgi:hypothetical protein
MILVHPTGEECEMAQQAVDVILKRKDQDG